jgi:hypothetical protein
MVAIAQAIRSTLVWTAFTPTLAVAIGMLVLSIGQNTPTATVAPTATATATVEPTAQVVITGPSAEPTPVLPVGLVNATEIENKVTEPEKPVAKLAFKPSFKPKIPSTQGEESTPSEIENKATESEKPVAKPAFKPSFKPKMPPKSQ